MITLFSWVYFVAGAFMIGSWDDTGGKGGQEIPGSASPLGMANSEFRPGSLELCPLRPGESPRMKLPQSCRQHCTCPAVSSQGKGRVSLSLFWTSLLSVSPSCYVLPWRAWLQLLNHFPVGVGGSCEHPVPSPPPSHLFSRLNKPSVCSHSSPEQVLQPSGHPRAPLLNSLPFISIFPVLGVQYGCNISDMPYQYSVNGDSHFPQLCSYSPGFCWTSLLPGHVAASHSTCCLPYGLFHRAPPQKT